MSKELNVKMRLWDTAHTVEAEAMKAGDAAALTEAAYWKGQLSLAILKEQEDGRAQVVAPQEGFIPCNGVAGALSGMGPLAGVGVRDGE